MNYKKYGFEKLRLEKRSKLLSEGINPYPYDFKVPQEISEAIEISLKKEESGEELHFSVVVVGRIWAKRGMGKTIFCDVKDESGKIQIYFRKNNFGEKEWELISMLDLGDILGVEGSVFRTKTGELTVEVKSFSLLAKAVVPIPIGKEAGDKVYYRTSDAETKYRERYLHWMLDKEDRERIKKRTKIISSIRRYMEKDGFLEVSTPTIEFVYGGAEARPFRTSIWALGHKEGFLRISPELYLKRYTVAGFNKVFTICQNFRNEGIDIYHNPEFTMMEWYEAFTDYNCQMKRVETLVSEICKEVCGTTKIKYQDIELDFSIPWERISMLDAIKEYAGLDVSSMSVEDLKKELDKREIEYYEPLPWGIAIVELFEKACEEHLVQPTFIFDFPKEISPLTKVKRRDERLVERFEAYINKMEIANAYSELTDPVDQLERFIEQREAKKEDVDYEIHPLDADFVKAIGCGMPPTGGLGLGIDRLIMLLTDAPSIRDIIPFPMVKPKY